MTTTDLLTTQLRDRITDAWKTGPLFVDPIIRPGLTDRQRTSVEGAVRRAEASGFPVYVAVIPPIGVRYSDEWSQFTADLAYRMYEGSGGEQVLVLITEGENAARNMAYVVDENGPSVPPSTSPLLKSSTDDFLPLELAVPYQLDTLVAAANGAAPPPAPDFDPRDIGARNEDYIEATGLDNENPDTLVFAATGLAALGLTAWVFSRRNRYGWKAHLTSAPELVRRHRLEQAVERSRTELPEPVGIGEEVWAIRDRGGRIQESIEAIVTAHPDWADHTDHSHRQAIYALVSSDEWVRSMLERSSAHGEGVTAEPQFCYFFPAHAKPVSSHVMKQAGTVLTISACETCIADLRAGRDPVCLMVPKSVRSPRSRPVPYFRRDDAYATSGFGSFAPLEDAILDYGVPGAKKPATSGGVA